MKSIADFHGAGKGTSSGVRPPEYARHRGSTIELPWPRQDGDRLPAQDRRSARRADRGLSPLAAAHVHDQLGKDPAQARGGRGLGSVDGDAAPGARIENGQVMAMASSEAFAAITPRPFRCDPNHAPAHKSKTAGGAPRQPGPDASSAGRQRHLRSGRPRATAAAGLRAGAGGGERLGMRAARVEGNRRRRGGAGNSPRTAAVAAAAGHKARHGARTRRGVPRAPNIATVGPISTMRPRYMTAVRCAMWREAQVA